MLPAGIFWLRNERRGRTAAPVGFHRFLAVQLQGLLGGLRVVLDAQMLADVRLGTAFGILHGCLGQAFSGVDGGDCVADEPMVEGAQ